MKDLVRINRSGEGVVWVSLNDPENRNAMSEEMALAFEKEVDALKNDESVRAVVLTGEGKAFSGGGHLDMLLAKTKIGKEENRELMVEFYSRFLSIRELDVPVIAAINGHAVGAGLCVALSCDIRIAVTEAKLGLNFVNIGLHPGMGATYFLPRLVGSARAAELMFTGSIIDAESALKLGMINAVCSAEQLKTKVEELLAPICAAGPQAVRELKASLRMSLDRTLPQCLEREAKCQSEDYAGPQFLEGIMAAKEKRKPKFV